MKNLILTATLMATLLSSAIAGNYSDSAKYYFDKGQDLKNQKKYLVASQSFDKALEFDPRFTKAHIENGYVNLEMRKTNIALDHFNRAYALDPTNKEVVGKLMELYFNYRQYDKALQFASQCTSCEDANRVIGMSHYNQENYPAAENALMLAVNKNPADAEATYTLARTYLDMEFYKKAVPFYEKAIILDAKKNAWQYELGLIFYNLGDFKNAVRYFDMAAVNGYVQSNDFKENMGYAAVYSGEYEKGEALIMEVWKRKPGNKELLRDLAEGLYKQKQFQKSLDYCQKLMEIDANDAKALYQAGLNFQKIGQKEKGQKMCDKAIEMDPSLSNLRQKREMPGM